MGRLSTRFAPPPVRIWRASARVTGASLQTNVEQTKLGAGDYGQREVRFASVPIRLRIQRSAGPNRDAAQAATIPMGPTRRKRGYPPITTLPGGE